MRWLKKFLKKLEESRRRQKLFLIISMACLTTIYLICMNFLNRRVAIIEDDFSWTYQIDEILEDNNKLIISGWAFKLDENSERGNFEILLYEVNSGRVFYPEMNYQKRRDVNQYFLCEYDYENSGFIGEIDKEKLDLENQIYEILLRSGETYKAFSTQVYYSSGKMMFVNPTEYVPLSVNGTSLEHIVNEGILRIYEPQNYTYVYQYGNQLYWIFEQEDVFGTENTSIEYQIETTQVDRLPLERVYNGWLWDNLGFNFADKEDKELSTEKYRVAKSDIPSEYSITKMWTGIYDGDWKWINFFRPWYEF